MSKKKDVIEYALKYIYRYPKTEKELVIKLREKKYTDNEIEKAINFLKKQGWLDDKKFARLYVESELIKKGKPKHIVISKLYMKGISKEIIDEILLEFQEDINKGVLKKIQKEIEKYKAKGLNGFDIIQKLISRGYSLSDIKKVLK